MAQPLSTLMTTVARPQDGLHSAALWGGAIVGALLLVGASGLWVHYGTAVFFETIAAGFASCF